MNFKDVVAQKKKELELWEQQEKERKAKLKQAKEAQALLSTQSQTEILENLAPVIDLTPTLDAIRGIYFFTTLVGDKKMNKDDLERQLKIILLTPQGFGQFLENISRYLKRI
jgi:hypothetical protein